MTKERITPYTYNPQLVQIWCLPQTDRPLKITEQNYQQIIDRLDSSQTLKPTDLRAPLNPMRCFSRPKLGFKTPDGTTILIEENDDRSNPRIKTNSKSDSVLVFKIFAPDGNSHHYRFIRISETRIPSPLFVSDIIIDCPDTVQKFIAQFDKSIILDLLANNKKGKPCHSLSTSIWLGTEPSDEEKKEISRGDFYRQQLNIFYPAVKDFYSLPSRIIYDHCLMQNLFEQHFLKRRLNGEEVDTFYDEAEKLIDDLNKIRTKGTKIEMVASNTTQFLHIPKTTLTLTGEQYGTSTIIQFHACVTRTRDNTTHTDKPDLATANAILITAGRPKISDPHELKLMEMESDQNPICISIKKLAAPVVQEQEPEQEQEREQERERELYGQKEFPLLLLPR